MKKTKLEIGISTRTAELFQSELKSGASGSVALEFQDYEFLVKLDSSLDGDGPDAVLLNLGARRDTRDGMAFNFPNGMLPDDVTTLVNRAYEEALRSFERGCSMASIGMCGRSIETLLGALYEERAGVHPSQDKNKPGMNAVINYLKRAGFEFPTGLKERMELIAEHRNMAVHGNIVLPSDDEARSTIYMTKDVLQLLSVKAGASGAPSVGG